VLLPSVRLDPLADLHPPSVPALFSKLDAVAPSLARFRDPCPPRTTSTLPSPGSPSTA